MVLFFLGLLAIFKDKYLIKFITGLTAFFLALLIIYKMVFYNPAFTEDIHDQNVQVIEMVKFSSQLPPNRGIDPTFRKDLRTYTIADRLDLTWHFITWGWYFLVISAVIFIVLGLIKYPIRKSLAISLISFLCIILLLSVIVVRPILAEYHKSQGDDFLSVQQYQKSFNSYSLAVKYNNELLSNGIFALNYGETCYNLKTTSSPYYFLYFGNELLKLERIPEAIDLLAKAKSLSNNDPDIIRALSKAITNQGNDYIAKGVLGSAVDAWDKSFQNSPGQIENLYFLSFIYTKLGLYNNAISAGQQFILFSDNDSIVSNTYANMGDACYWLKDYLLARKYYENSRATDLFLNYRAGRSLGGT